jgi:3-oxoacyl-[acyl-carrier protein] reductase
MTLVVLGGDSGFGAALVAALDRGPATVAAVAATDDATQASAALAGIAEPSAVVHVCAQDPATATRPLVATDPAGWHAGCEEVVWRALTSLQTAHAVLSPHGDGRVVVVTATAGVSGAPGSVPFVAAVEGVRALAKSAARQWGGVGISVNCVSVPLELLAPTHAGHTSFLPPPALVRDDPVADVAGAVEFLCSPGARGISGATLLVDGGAVMAP